MHSRVRQIKIKLNHYISSTETLIHTVGSFAAITPPVRGDLTPPYPPFQHNSISRFILQARSYLVRPPEFPRRPRIIRHLPSYNNGTEGLAQPPPPPPPARECQSTGIGWYFQQLCNFLGIVGSSRELLLYLHLPTTLLSSANADTRREDGGDHPLPCNVLQYVLFSRVCITLFLLEFFGREFRVIVPKRHTEMDSKDSILYVCI